MFRQFSITACAIAAIGIIASSPAFATSRLSQYSLQKSSWSRFVLVARPSLQDKVTLNPQPLPPKFGTVRAGR